MLLYLMLFLYAQWFLTCSIVKFVFLQKCLVRLYPYLISDLYIHSIFINVLTSFQPALRLCFNNELCSISLLFLSYKEVLQLLRIHAASTFVIYLLFFYSDEKTLGDLRSKFFLLTSDRHPAQGFQSIISINYDIFLN